MRFSILWMAGGEDRRNDLTLKCLKTELSAYGKETEILLYGASKERAAKIRKALEEGGPAEGKPSGAAPGGSLSGKVKLVAAEGMEGASDCEIFRDAAGRAKGDYLTQLADGDTWSAGYLTKLAQAIQADPGRKLLMGKKRMPDDKAGLFTGDRRNTLQVVAWEKDPICYPFYFGGTVVKRSFLKEGPFCPELGLEAERKLFLELTRRAKEILFLPDITYCSGTEREGDLTFYHGLYEKSYYLESFSEFWLPYLRQLREEGGVPVFIQTNFMFSLNRRLLANWNNKNKHAVDEEEARECLRLAAACLEYLDDEVIFDARKLPGASLGDSMKWVYGILKYGKDYHFNLGYLAGKEYYRADGVFFNRIKNLRTNILFMDARNGRLEIDGTVHPVLYSMADRIFFEFGGREYEPVFNGRYGLTKVMGVSIFKSHSFHVSIPYQNSLNAVLRCYAQVGGARVQILYKYESHFSRINNRFWNQYWVFQEEGQSYIMTRSGDGLKVEACDRKKHRAQEIRLWKEMFRTKKDRKRAWLFILIRAAYFAARPVLKKKPIWMYLDKIYKAGDSSEYLYKYASAQDNDFRHYYLVDKRVPDYRRLRREGYRPLVRGSVLHRLVFLMADMMVISNSTVFAFNNFGMINSGYVRDLPDFHVCCVQHGMSVQKIAVAQNRLRDNTRLYFCASKYELRNLSHPAYDYFGYDALKLTGVPRYDGLVDRSEKQIMISPTWRMQAAVPVRTSEGEARDYNPHFKETSYFKVYNSLINDPRLIAAAKKYGYKIKYVLHPIVSSQVRDFDRNDYVEIIPAAGDMSYEDMFCESSLMVTDFSGIQFDFAYMRKPLLYLHHRDIPQHYEEGSFFYDTMAFGEICHDNDELIRLLEEYMAGGCRMKPEFVRRADDFFYYNDHENCRRIYETMLDYQDRYILHTKKEEPEKLWGEFPLAERPAIAAAVDQILEEEKVQPASTTITDDYFDQEVRPRTVLLLGLGKNVRGNMQYILQVLNHSHWFENFRMYVRVSEETDPLVQNFIRQNGWERTRTVVDDREYSRLMESCKYLITEVFFPKGWVKKPDQVYINIWHGTPLKKLGLAKNSRNIHKDGNTQRNFIEADYLVYPNEYTRKHMLESYKVENLINGRVALLGYARTGGLLAACGEDLTELKAKLAPGGEQIFAYMPTWKDYLSEEAVVEETRELLDYLDGALTDQQILYSNLHHKVSDSLDYGKYRHIRKFPSDVDSYRLLAATDALITDYSSVFYDYLASRKQIVIYCPDYKLYQKRRGTYMDLMELPFDKCKTKEEVAEALNRGKRYDDTGAWQEFCAYDSPENARKLCGLIYGDFMSDGMPVFPKAERTGRRVLVYSEAFEDSAATDLLREAVRRKEDEEVQIVLSGEMETIDSHKASAYPLLQEVPVLGIMGDTHLTGRGKALRNLFLEGKRDFDEVIPYLRYDYALAAARSYGRAPFDEVLIYDVKDPEQILMLSMIWGEKTLFVNKEMLDAWELGDRLMKGILPYAASRCGKVCVMEEALLARTREILPECGVELVQGVEAFPWHCGERAAKDLRTEGSACSGDAAGAEEEALESDGAAEDRDGGL